MLLDNTWRTSFDFGKESPIAYSFGAVGGPIDYYLFYGPTPKQVVETYAWLTGTPPLPPLWSLGFQQSRYSYMTAGARAGSRRLACAAIASRPTPSISTSTIRSTIVPFTVNRATFPDLAG